MKKLYKWQKTYLLRLALLSNEETFKEYNSLAEEDSRDGFFTEQGEWQWEEIQKELTKRLRICGFLPLAEEALSSREDPGEA